MEEKIIQILNRIHPGVDYISEKNIFTGGSLDSIEFVEFITSVEESFDVTIDFDYLEPKNFDTIELIKKAIKK